MAQAVRTSIALPVGGFLSQFNRALLGSQWVPFNALAQGKKVAVAPDGTVYIIGTDDGVYQIWNAPGAPARLRFRASSRSWTRVCARSTMATSRGFGATS